MRYVILRDDDTNILTPPECLERLYRPFLNAGLPVNLATIPAVSMAAKRPDGQPEAFLWGRARLSQRAAADFGPDRGTLEDIAENLSETPEFFPPRRPSSSNSDLMTTTTTRDEGRGRLGSRCGGLGQTLPASEECLPITRESALAQYLRENPNYHIVQHGFHHEPFEFDSDDRSRVVHRLESGEQLLRQAGFPRPAAFVAPHDKFSPVSFREAVRRFPVISSGWFELRRLPWEWWPHYALARALKRPHWRVNGTVLLSHPGCLLSYTRPYDSMLASLKAELQRRQLTVLVTHWWEYFRDGRPDEPFIAVLHSLAEYLRAQNNLNVITFASLAHRKLPLG